jgi:hypothetical protein
MVQTFSDGKTIYSVDMMFAYISVFKPRSRKVKIESYEKTLDFDGWGDPSKGVKYSAKDVLETPSKFKDEINRIEKADMRFPIIVTSKGHVVDGVHRITKAVMQGMKTIRAYIFDDETMRKFVINRNGDWTKVHAMRTDNFISLFCKRFCIDFKNKI